MIKVLRDLVTLLVCALISFILCLIVFPARTPDTLVILFLVLLTIVLDISVQKHMFKKK